MRLGGSGINAICVIVSFNGMHEADGNTIHRSDSACCVQLLFLDSFVESSIPTERPGPPLTNDSRFFFSPFFRRQVVKSKTDFRRRTINKKNESDQLIMSQISKKKTTKVYRCSSPNKVDLREKFKNNGFAFPSFRLLCTSRTCITPVTLTPF